MRNRELQGDRNLLQIALDVRMRNNGSMEGYDHEQVADIVCLRHALKTWTPGLPRYQTFDTAVKTLIEAALAEVRNDSLRPCKHKFYGFNNQTPVCAYCGKKDDTSP